MKIKKLLLMLSMLGLVSSLFSQTPGSGNKSYKLTDDEGDSITAVNDPAQWELGTSMGFSQFGEIKLFSEADLDSITNSNGTATGRSGLFAITGGEWIYNEDTSMQEYTASSAKLEPIEDLGDFVGAPLVADVYAQQIPGSKNVTISFWLQYDTSKSSNVYIEVWFRESSNEPQWERCMAISNFNTEYGWNHATSTYDLLVAHTQSHSSDRVDTTWDAGTEKLNFKGENCEIRVMAIYPKEDPNSPGTLIPAEQQGSGWDGYEVELGDKFVRTSDPQVDVNHPDFHDDAYAANEYFIAHIEQNNISRKGTAVIDGKNFPVYALSDADFLAVTGTAGTAGHYAFSGFNEFLDNGTISFECIIGKVIPQ